MVTGTTAGTATLADAGPARRSAMNHMTTDYPDALGSARVVVGVTGGVAGLQPGLVHAQPRKSFLLGKNRL
jgi:hypothetical protein